MLFHRWWQLGSIRHNKDGYHRLFTIEIALGASYSHEPDAIIKDFKHITGQRKSKSGSFIQGWTLHTCFFFFNLINGLSSILCLALKNFNLWLHVEINRLSSYVVLVTLKGHYTRKQNPGKLNETKASIIAIVFHVLHVSIWGKCVKSKKVVCRSGATIS